MSRRRLGVGLVCAWLVLGCSPEPQPPHLFWLTADTLRADHTSMLGYARDTTPHLARLAADGRNYRQAVTLVSKTGPSFASHLTGLTPEAHGVTSNRYSLPDSVPTLAERLAEQGYTTVAFVANPILAPRKGFARGFERYDEFGKQDPLAVQLQAFLRWAERHDWSQPTFVWLHTIDPHGPYTPPEDLRERFVGDALFAADPRRVPLDYELPEGTPPNRVLGALPKYQRIGDEDRVAWYVSQYDAEIVAMDRAFGKLLGFLRERGLYRDSGIVFTSDHGESLGEHDYYFEHGWFVYDATARVPLIVKTPGNAAAQTGTSDVQVSNLDTVPTLLAMAGAAPPAGLAGRDLRTVPEQGAQRLANPTTYPQRFVALRTPRAKYIRELATGGEQTFRLDRDPAEEHDLTAQDPELVERMRAEWQALEAATRGVAPKAAPSGELAPSSEEQRQLEHLGYID